MKRTRHLFFGLFLLVFLQSSISRISAQNIKITTPADTIAFVDTKYTYDVNDSTAAAKLPVTYSLVKGLSGMIIYPATGVIEWTPNSITSGGKVIVKATNTALESVTQEFFINVSNAIPCPETMVAYWKMDENNGPVYADYYGANDAHITGIAPVSTTGQIDKAQEFDPLNSEGLYVEDDTLFDWGTEEDFSIECWFWLNEENNSYRVIIGRNEGVKPLTTGVHWWIGVDPTNRVNFAIRNDLDESTCTSDSIVAGWHHIVAVRDAASNTMYLYVDNTLGPKATAEYTGWGPGLSTDSVLCIGWLQPGPGDGSAYYFDGKIDELIVHNKALTSSEIANRYSKGSLGKPACRTGNFAPLFRTTPVTDINEDVPYTYKYLANDIDGNTLHYDIPVYPTWLTWDQGNKTLSGTPTNDNVGTFGVKIKVDDGTTDTVFQNFNITVANVNDPPQLSSIGGTALTFTEGDSSLVITSTITVADVDDINLESAVISISANYSNGADILSFANTGTITGTWHTSTGELTLSGVDTKANYQAALRTITYKNTSENPSALTRTISFKVYDGELYSNIPTRNISVVPVNDPPVITGHKSLSTPEDDTILIKKEQLIYSDVDNTTGEITLAVQDGIHYTHIGNIVTPEANYNDTIHVNVKLSDPHVSVDYVLPVYVTPVNDVPYFTFTTPPAAYEGEFYYFTLTAADADVNDALTFSAPQLPSWLQLNGNLLTGKPAFVNVGANTVKLRVTDGHINIDSTIVINVIMTNHKPYITSTPVTTVNEDENYVYDIQYEDPDTQDVLILYTDSIPGWLSYNSTLKRLSGTPTNNEVGYKADSTYYIRLRISDTKQDSIQEFTITVHNINDAPVATNQTSIPVSYPDSSLIITLDSLIVQDVDNPLSDMAMTIFPGTGYSIIENIITVNSGFTGQLLVKIVVDDGMLESPEYDYKITVKEHTGVEEQTGNVSVIKVYPNPADEMITFEYNLINNGWLEVYSDEGLLILKQILNSNQNNIEMELNNIPSGLYLYKIYNRSELYTGKFMVK